MMLHTFYSQLCQKEVYIMLSEKSNFQISYINLREALVQKKRLKKQTLSAQGGGVYPSSLIKPKITGFSNHLEMAFGHHNMNANASGLAWLGPPISSFPPNTSLYPV